MSNTPPPTPFAEVVSERELLFPSPEEEEEGEERLEVEREVDEEVIEDPLEEDEVAPAPLVERVENGMTTTLPPTKRRIRHAISTWTTRRKKLLEANLGSDRILVREGEVPREDVAVIEVDVEEGMGVGLRVELRWRGRRGRVKVLSRVLGGKLRLIDCNSRFVFLFALSVHSLQFWTGEREFAKAISKFEVSLSSHHVESVSLENGCDRRGESHHQSCVAQS